MDHHHTMSSQQSKSWPSKHRTNYKQVAKKDIEALVSSGLSDLVNNPLDFLLDVHYWQWRYFESPVTAASLLQSYLPESSLMVAVCAERVIGKVGNLLMPFCVAGKSVIIPLMEGLSFSSGSRSWSRLRTLLALSYQKRQQFNSEFSFAVTPRSSFDLYQRLGCRVVGQLPVYTGIISGNDFARLRGVPFPLSLTGWCVHPLFGVRYRKDPAAGITIRRIDHFGPEFDQIWNTIGPQRCVAVNKNTGYLNWRYARHPGQWYDILAAYRDGQPDGLIVFRMVSAMKRAYVLELIAARDDAKTMGALLDSALKHMKAEGMASVTASCLNGSPVQPLFKAAGLSPLPTRFWDMHLIVEIAENHSSGPVENLAAWELSLGDWLLH
ncbi:MAG: hypothetical protein V1793_01795 [Pseudomonadota bacterium]